MHRPSSRDRDRRHLDDRHRHLGAGRSRHLHLERRLDVRHRHRRRRDDRPDDPHLRDELREARGAVLDAELPGGDRLGSADEGRLLHLDGGHRRLRHLGACPGSRRTGCCPGANGPCPGWTRTGCFRDAGRDGVHADAGWRGLRHPQPARASHRREQLDAACSASVHLRLLRVQRELPVLLPPGPRLPELAQACAWVLGSVQIRLKGRPWVPEQLVPRGPMVRPVLASCRDGRSMASRHLDAARRASTPRGPPLEAARYRRRWSSAPRGGDEPLGARRSTMRS